ncbi:MAG: zinc dependent phospholipase C family protein [Oscillospiraceae bacterium]|nr:zinc dependent phospholipase C family protein [Oscillospiraceae bacterium]
MPAFVTNSLFGGDVLPRLDPELRAIAKRSLPAFEWGLQGPDLLFYHAAPLTRDPLPGYGNRMHDERTARLFYTAARYVAGRTGRKDFSDCFAYTLGFCCHYALDRESHPLVFARQGRLYRACPSTSYHGLHYRLESDIDSALYRQKTGKPVQRFPLLAKTAVSRKTRMAVAHWYSRVLWETYGEAVTPQKIASCFAQARATVGFLLEPTGWAALYAARAADAIAGNRARIEGHVRLADPSGDPLNLLHAPWRCEGGRPRRESFLDLYNRALASATELTELMARCVEQQIPWPLEKMPSFSCGAPEFEPDS